MRTKVQKEWTDMLNTKFVLIHYITIYYKHEYLFKDYLLTP